jgi:arylsulfatase A-like enzyme
MSRPMRSAAALSAAALLYCCEGAFEGAPTSAGRARLRAGARPPHVLLIVADDLGWDDLGFAGSNISTPNINRIASEGVRLTQLYGQPVCTPSRAAIMTGRYPIAYGLQSYVIDPPGVDYGLPLNETLLPQLLKEAANYSTYAVGKWHLGDARFEFTPTYRGYDYFHGFYR